MSRSIETIRKEIDDAKYDRNFLKTELAEINRQRELYKTKIRFATRDDFRELRSEASELKSEMEQSEREIRDREDKIRDLIRDREYAERDKDNAQRQLDSLRNDNTSDTDQVYDFGFEKRQVEAADRQINMINDQISTLEQEIREWKDTYRYKSSEYHKLVYEPADIRQENHDDNFQRKIYFDDQARAKTLSLNELNVRLKSLYEELEIAKNEERNKGNTIEDKKEDYTYEGDLDEVVFEEPEEVEVVNEGEGRTVIVDDDIMEENEDENQPEYAENISPYYLPVRKALEQYAADSDCPYQEYKVRQGFSASVGNTNYRYTQPDKLTIRRKNGVPSVEDFVAILKAENSRGHKKVNFGDIDTPEYKARLLLACAEVGMRPVGNIEIKDLQKLSPQTLEAYNNLPSSAKNLSKIGDLRKRKSGNASPSGNAVSIDNVATAELLRRQQQTY